MKKTLSIVFAALAGFLFLDPSIAEAARVRHAGPNRNVVVVRPGHPIHRVLPHVVIRRPALGVRIVPARFLPVVVWASVVTVRPAAGAIVWQDAETLSAADGWSETVFNSDQRGTKLFLEVVSGRVQFDFAEVVFENGDCQVVDFADKTHRPGFYSLLDFRDGRKVDHVRLIACAKKGDAKVALVMAK